MSDDLQHLRKAIRQEMRAKRRHFSTEEQAVAARDLCALVSRQPFFIAAQRLGFYIANDGEIDPNLILQQALTLLKDCYLPKVDATNSLEFLAFNQDSVLQANRYNIPEPTNSTAIELHALDVVFVPLVAFDKTGARLGMGGGYYDRSFAFKTQRGAAPALIGLAHSCQEVESLNTESWDIPLEAIATERGIVRCQASHADSFLSQDCVEHF